VFHVDRDLILTRPRLALDGQRRHLRGFVSHAHADHLARHETIYCTPFTARIARQRLGPVPRYRTLDFGVPVELADCRLTAFPAGHIRGSAMLWAESDGLSLLYTGDFRLRPSRTSERAEVPRADILITESTFGEPQYRMPPREESEERLLEGIAAATRSGRIAVIHAYGLGKAQEVGALLAASGVPYFVQAWIEPFHRAYETDGVQLGAWSSLPRTVRPGSVVIAPPRTQLKRPIAGLGSTWSCALTGWALDERTLAKWQVDAAIPWSDHADYDELIESVERSGATRIFCTHGSARFAEDLRARGHRAETLGERTFLAV
jgi:Cft2 family RNA processing exonuclease